MGKFANIQVFTSFEKKISENLAKVKVMVCHTGKNLNGSKFSKENIKKALYSIEGIPIVGEFKEDKEDFGGHGGKIELTDEGVKFLHTTKPYGFVPFGELANVRFETIVDKDGHTKREWLVVDAYVWYKRYPEVERILEGNNNQSMEIKVNSYSRDLEDGYMDITDFIFECLCILGEKVDPAMKGAKVLPYADIKAEFQKMLKEAMSELKEVSDLKFKKKEAHEETVVETSGVTESKEVPETNEKKEYKTEEGAISGNEDTVADDNENENAFSKEDYEVLERAYDFMKSEFEKLEEQVKHLNNLISEYESAERKVQLEKIYSEFSELSDDEIGSVRAKDSEMSFEEVENALFSILGRKNKQFSQKEVEEKVSSFKVAEEETAEALPYGGLFEKFSK